MADEILIKVRADLDGFSADMQEAKKIGNSAIQEIEKNDLFAKANNNAQELKKSIELIAKASGNISLKGLNADELINDTTQLKKLIEQLTQSLKGLKQGTTEFNALDAIIKSANVQLTKLNVTSEATGKSLRTQMREAQLEVAKLSEKFGATSKEAIHAAKRAAELRDRLGDAKNLADAFNPDAKFSALSRSITGVASGFSAVQGAMGLLGSESEDVQKTLLKVQSALALSQGLQSLGEAKDSFVQLKAVALDAFKSIRGAIGSTGIGLLVVALGTIVAYWDDIKEAVTGVSGKVKENADLARKDLEIQDQKLSALNDQDEILKAQGVSERRILEKKKEQIAAIYEKKAADLQAIIDVERAEFESTKRRRNDLFKYLGIYGKVFQNLDFFNVKKAKEDLDKVENESKSSLLKLENQIKGYENKIVELDKKTNDEKRKEYDKTIEERKRKDKEYNDFVDKLEEDAAKKVFKQWEDEKKAQEDLDNYLEKSLEDNAKKQFESWENEKKNINSVSESIGDAYKRGYQTAKEYNELLIEDQKKSLKVLLDYAENGILLQIGLNPQDVNNVRNSVQQFIKILNDQTALTEEKWAAGALAAQNAYQTVSNAIFNSDTQRRQEELAALQSQQEEELRLAGDNEQKKEIIRQKYQLKEREIKRKQAEADKRKAIFDATVSLATAVIRAGVITPFALLTAALGAAQIALIAATPIPKFSKGGAVPSSDIEGMINGRPHEAGGVLIEAEGNEFITRKAQAMKSENLGLLEAINMSDSDRDAYINRHYVIPALKAKESQATQNYRHSVIEAENNLIAKVSSHTLKSIDRRLIETNQSIKGLAKKDYSW